ncbi:uncharacterized protein LOC111627614 [Centruroides sculpturatus]|uniref:uncharacterized protein LOC111627614 n=1 Tax=Centruroides sculpturatus TaxID=218467 RepID=UPI000C6D6400|nr:uncharacterized protein LOC111627614 [Centruroides sculpturatus]
MKTACCVLWPLTFFSLIAIGYAVQCYICSWSPDDKNNRTNYCTDENFQNANLYFDRCKVGCEVHVQWDPNGRMEHIRRNCLDKEVNLTNKCVIEERIGWKVKKCACQYDLCNTHLLSGSFKTSPDLLTAFVIFLCFFLTLKTSDV